MIGVERLGRSKRVRDAFLGVTFALAVLTVGAFAADIGDATPDPVLFEQTTDTGIAAEDRQALEARGLAVPKAQVFYSQYEFVVGYHGVEHAVTSLQQAGHEQQFGYPIAVYVSDFTGMDVTLTDEGYLDPDSTSAVAPRPTWTDAEEAAFVVGSEARTPTGETAVPFSETGSAESFASQYGGDVVGWETLQEQSFDVDGAAAVRDRVDDQHTSADERVAVARSLADRDTELVVGEDTETIQAAIDAATPGTTVRIPEGTYEETPVVDRPLTLYGENATIEGDRSEAVIEVRADDVALVGLSVTGVGNATEPAEDIGDELGPGESVMGETDSREGVSDETDPDESVSDETGPGEDPDSWDQSVEAAYGHADAGILAVETAGLYVTDVAIETPANGILLRDAEGTVVEQVTVEGSLEWYDGLMGLMSVRSPVVVQHSTFDGGRDGIYLHRAPESVVRNSTFRDNRFGIHYMYTSDALTADSVFRGQDVAGLTIMTDSARNSVVGNDVRNAHAGLLPSGSRSYIAENVFAHNGLGLSTAAGTSLYERNVVYGNEIGIRASSFEPSNRIVENDIVANDQPVQADVGPLRIWSHDGVGNYWGGEAVRSGEQERYTPTDPAQGSQHRVEGAATLSASPAATLLDALRETTPGMRDGDVVDTAPLAEPVQPAVLAALGGESDE